MFRKQETSYFIKKTKIMQYNNENTIIDYYDNGTYKIFLNNNLTKEDNLTDNQIKSILYFVNNLEYLQNNKENNNEKLILLGKTINIGDSSKLPKLMAKHKEIILDVLNYIT